MSDARYHRYPRRWKYARDCKNKGGYKYIEVRVSGGPSYNIMPNGEEQKGHFGEAGVEVQHEKWGYVETFDHHGNVGELEQLEKRCAIVYLKGLIKELRSEVLRLQSRVEELEGNGS